MVKPEIASELLTLSESVDACARYLADGVKNGDVVSVIAEQKIVEFLKGLAKVMREFSKIE